MEETYSKKANITPNDVISMIGAHWHWYVLSGGVLMLLGVASILFPFTASIAGNYAIGSVLVVAGIMQIIHAFHTAQWRCAGLSWLGGLLAVIAGGILLLYPLAGVITLTTVITAFLLVSGGFKFFYAFRLRPDPGWKSLAFAGALALLLALLVLSASPQAAAWLLGLLIGFDLLFSGAWLVSLAIYARRADSATSR